MTDHRSVHLPPIHIRGVVWSSAANCRLYERDPGPTHYTESPTPTPGDPHSVHPDDARTITRDEAWRDIYARSLIHELHAQPDHIRDALTFSRTQLRTVSRPRYRLTRARTEWRNAPDPRTGLRRALHVLTPTEYADDREFWHRAVDICTRAHHITHAAGADTDPYDRARLLAGIEHRFHLVFGFFPDPTRSAAQLAARLQEIDRQAAADHRPPPDHPDTSK